MDTQGFTVTPFSVEDAREAMECYRSDPVAFVFDEDVALSFAGANFYALKREDGANVAFFAMIYGRAHRCALLGFVYVKADYRRNGVFGVIVEVAKELTPVGWALAINAEKRNRLAVSIYSKRFPRRWDDADTVAFTIVEGKIPEAKA